MREIRAFAREQRPHPISGRPVFGLWGKGREMQLSEPIFGGTVIVCPASSLVKIEGRLTALLGHDDTGSVLASPALLVEGERRAESRFRLLGVTLPEQITVQRLDLAAELLYGDGLDGLALLNACQRGVHLAGLRQHPYSATGDSRLESIIWQTPNGRQICVRLYDAGIEHGTDRVGERLRFEVQERWVGKQSRTPEQVLGLRPPSAVRQAPARLAEAGPARWPCPRRRSDQGDLRCSAPGRDRRPRRTHARSMGDRAHARRRSAECPRAPPSEARASQGGCVARLVRRPRRKSRRSPPATRRLVRRMEPEVTAPSSRMTERQPMPVIVCVIAASGNADQGVLQLDPDALSAIEDAVSRAMSDQRIADAPDERALGYTASAREVSARIGMSADWVRAHAAALGGRRMGNGSEPPHRFSVEIVEARLASLNRQRDEEAADPQPKPRKSRRRAANSEVQLLRFKGQV